ncbi:MAG: peptidase S8 [Rubrivivax sp. SCN 70-15]|nr:MAG: peptidase S8 [Rubrivivax sp. SCN 70-15]
MVVVYKSGRGAAVRADVAQAGGKVAREIGAVNALAVRVSPAGLAALQRNPNVEFVEPDVERHVLGSSIQRAGITGAGATGTEVVPYGIGMVQADQLSDAYTGNRKVCIIDSGIDLGHEDLAANHADGVNLTSSGHWYTDENAHGTHVAGTVAAIGGNGVGVVGVNPGGHVNLYIAKVFDASGSTDSSVVMDAVQRCADAGANVISMSLGGGDPSAVERRLFAQLASRGILSIAAAGNAGDQSISYPAGYNAVMSVAAVDSTMARASFSQQNPDVEIAAPGVAVLSTIPPNIENLAQLEVGGIAYDAAPMTGSPRFSATGALVDFGTGEADDPAVAGKVCLIRRGNVSFAAKVTRCQNNGGIAAVVYNNAAGMLYGTLGGVPTAIPSVGTSDTIGAGLLARIGQSTTVAVVPDPALYAAFNGTSMATPHVAGVAALVWSYFPTCTAQQIRTALDRTALELGAPGRDTAFGFGLVQARAAHDFLARRGCPAQ